jgi:hypothetical protein
MFTVAVLSNSGFLYTLSKFKSKDEAQESLMRIQAYLKEARSNQHRREQVSLQLEEDKSHPVEICTLLAFLAWCYLLQLQTYDELVSLCSASSTLTYQRRNLSLRTTYLQTMALDKISKVEIFEQSVILIPTRGGGVRSVSRWGLRIRLRITRSHTARQTLLESNVNAEGGADGLGDGSGSDHSDGEGEWRRQWQGPREERGEGSEALPCGGKGGCCSYALHCTGWCVGCAYCGIQAYIGTVIPLVTCAFSAAATATRLFRDVCNDKRKTGDSMWASEGCDGTQTIHLRLGELVEQRDAGELQSLANSINGFVRSCDEGDDDSALEDGCDEQSVLIGSTHDLGSRHGDRELVESSVDGGKSPNSGHAGSSEPSLYDTRRTVLKTERCCVCLTCKAKVFFLPCKHIVCCPACADTVQMCPCCRKPIEERHVIFI